MASKIEDKNFYVGVTPYEHEGATYDVLNVGAGYRKGRGFYANIHAGWKTDWGGYGCTFDFSGNPLSDTIWVDVKESPKNSQKTIDEMAGALELAKNCIAYLFDQRNWTELKRLMKDVALCGYTYTIEERMKELRRYPNGSTTSESETTISNNEETMAKNLQAADLIGKSVCNGNAKYVIKSVDGDKVKVDFAMGDNAAKEMNMKAEQIEKLLQGGWQVENEELRMKNEEFATAKQEAPKAEEPKAKTVTMETEPKPKRKQPQTEATDPTPGPSPTMGGECHAERDGAAAHRPSKGRGRGEVSPQLTYSTYTNAKGKTCAKISGFAETDAAYQKEAAASLHGSATYENTKQGRVNFLLFGPRYAEVAKTVCQMLNEGKTVADCQAVVDAATEERAQKREEWKQKREAYREQREGKAQTAKPQGKTYTEAEVADLMRRVIAGDQEAMAIVNAMAA